jgi:hypothetical protein
MRRLAAFLALPLLLVAAPSARAQQTQGVVLRLLSQTAWNDADHTRLDLAVRAVNRTARTLDDLSLTITVFTSVGSRSAYELSLQADTGNFLLGGTTPETASIASGRDRAFRLPPTDLADLAQFGDTAIYPMKVELRSHDQTVATLRSPIIFLAKNPPQVPLDLTSTFVLSAPILYEPDGSFRTPWLQRQVAHGGELRAQAQALSRLAATPGAAFDVAVAPQLVDQLLAMRAGYRLRTGSGSIRVAAGKGGAGNAADTLADLRAMVSSRSVELSALPFAGPSLPALIAAGLAGDLPQQLSRGRDDVARALGRKATSRILHPPGSRLDQRSLFELHADGIRTLLVDARTVEQAQTHLGFAKPAVAALSVDEPTPIDAITPDDGVENLLQSTLPRQDPHLAVQQVIGELASIWLERPSVPRGIAMIVSERTGLPGYFFGPFVHALADAPWLHQLTAMQMEATHPPHPKPAELSGRSGPTFSGVYLSDLTTARGAIITYRSILTEKSTLPARLFRLVLLAESGQFATQEDDGERFLRAVIDRLQQQFGLVTADTSNPVTLTQRSGNVPVTIKNLTGHSVSVDVQLRSTRLAFLRGASQRVEIPRNDTHTLIFGVQARTTGRFPVQVLITTPDGHTTLSQGRLVVRSTAYNRIALVLTIGAALFLLALWARRALPWTKR